jgi:oligopeptide transport system substrate-binding protein
MKLHRLLSLLIGPVAVSLAMSACTTTAQTSGYFGKTQPPEGQVLRYVSGSEPESLDPQIGTGQPEARIYLALFEGLTEYDPKTGGVIPAIAERWDVNGDNSEFTFHLRHDARWSNGEGITAHDFLYTFRRGLSPQLASRNAYLAYYIQYAQGYNEGAVFVRDPDTGRFLLDGEDAADRVILPGDPKERAKVLQARKLKSVVRGKDLVPIRGEDIGVEALDDYTLRIRLTGPVPYLLGLMSHQFFRAVPRKAIEKYGDGWTRPENIVTAGPFKLKLRKPYDRLVVVRDPMYWDAARVRLDQITFYPIEDQTTMMNLYKAGEVDAVLNHTVPAAWVDRIRPLKDYMDKPELAIEYYVFNTKRPPMNDVRVRRAFNLAIDKAALAEFRRTTKPLISFTPEGIFDGYPRPAGASFNAQRARELLAEAGYRNTSGAYDASKFPIADVELTYNTLESNRQVAEFVQAQWKQNLGLTVPLKNKEWKTFLTEREALEYKGVARAGWVGDYLDPYTFLDLFSTETGNNGTGWWDPKFAQMLKDANRQPDPKQRYELLARAEAYMLDVQPVIPLSMQATNWVKKPYVKGMYANPVTLHPWKYVYIEHDPAKWDVETPGATD